MRSWILPILLGLSHGVADCISGYMIGMLPVAHSAWDIGGFILLYNVLAFGGQLPAGMLVDRFRQPRIAVLGSMLLIAMGMAAFAWNPLVAISLSGIGSAFFHVSGGMLALMAFPGRAATPGLFAAPGVIGLAVGGFLAFQGVAAAPFLLIAILLLGMSTVPFMQPRVQLAALQEEYRHESRFDLHDLLMILLLLAIAMRSAIWNIFQVFHYGDYDLLLAIGLAAMSGKLAGGFLADWIGWKRYVVGALLLATPLLTWGENRWYLLLPGIALLQSAVPVAVTAMWRHMPTRPATAAGMCFGFALVVGGIPMLLGFSPGITAVAIGLPVAALLYFLGIGRARSAAQTAE